MTVHKFSPLKQGKLLQILFTFLLFALTAAKNNEMQYRTHYYTHPEIPYLVKTIEYKIKNQTEFQLLEKDNTEVNNYGEMNKIYKIEYLEKNAITLIEDYLQRLFQNTKKFQSYVEKFINYRELVGSTQNSFSKDLTSLLELQQSCSSQLKANLSVALARQKDLLIDCFKKAAKLAYFGNWYVPTLVDRKNKLILFTEFTAKNPYLPFHELFIFLEYLIADVGLTLDYVEKVKANEFLYWNTHINDLPENFTKIVEKRNENPRRDIEKPNKVMVTCSYERTSPPRQRVLPQLAGGKYSKKFCGKAENYPAAHEAQTLTLIYDCLDQAGKDHFLSSMRQN